jgi:hypothetical protein
MLTDADVTIVDRDRAIDPILDRFLERVADGGGTALGAAAPESFVAKVAEATAGTVVAPPPGGRAAPTVLGTPDG